MQETLFPMSASQDPAEEIGLIFNTALVRTRTPSQERNLAAELAQITHSPACRAILSAAKELARTQKISELDAAEQMIQTFRKLDEVWSAYLHQEGLAAITSSP